MEMPVARKGCEQDSHPLNTPCSPASASSTTLARTGVLAPAPTGSSVRSTSQELRPEFVPRGLVRRENVKLDDLAVRHAVQRGYIEIKFAAVASAGDTLKGG